MIVSECVKLSRCAEILNSKCQKKLLKQILLSHITVNVVLNQVNAGI